MSGPENTPAFPCEGEGYGNPKYWTPGMTLRDYFAAKALGSIMQDKAIWDSTPAEERDIATRLYRWADAMVAARGQS